MTLATALHEWRHRRPHLRRVLIATGICAGLLVAADFPVRWFVLPGKSHNNLFAEYDPLLGWKLSPGVSSTRKNDLYTSRESVNSLGFRTPEVPFEKPPGMRRVVLIGDSHTEGYTVNDDETYARRLEGLLGEPYQVISLGVGGFSTDQELLTYLAWGRRFHPDVVVLQFFSNDPAMTVLDHYYRGAKPLFRRYGDRLVLTGVPVPDLRNTGLLSRSFMKRSAIALLLESMARQLAVSRDVQRVADMDEAWRVTDLLIRDLAQAVRADGARFAAFDANTRLDPEYDAHMRSILEKYRTPYLETDAAYKGDFEGYWYAGHWNQAGHAAIARVLAPQIAALLANPEASPEDGEGSPGY